MRAVQERYPSDSFYAEEIGEVAARRREVGPGLDRRSARRHGQLRQRHPVLLHLDRARGRRPPGRRAWSTTRLATRPSPVPSTGRRCATASRSTSATRSCSRTCRDARRRRARHVRKRHEALKAIRAHRSMGSAALTLSYVACGRFDVYAQGAGLSAWDVAAAGLIAERAGATVTTWTASPGSTWPTRPRSGRAWPLRRATTPRCWRCSSRATGATLEGARARASAGRRSGPAPAQSCQRCGRSASRG
jgi:hypothetical protein